MIWEGPTDNIRAYKQREPLSVDDSSYMALLDAGLKDPKRMIIVSSCRLRNHLQLWNTILGPRQNLCELLLSHWWATAWHGVHTVFNPIHVETCMICMCIYIHICISFINIFTYTDMIYILYICIHMYWCNILVDHGRSVWATAVAGYTKPLRGHTFRVWKTCAAWRGEGHRGPWEVVT